jgi:N-acetylmuramic acid 6-phosphate etherase
MLNKQHLFDQLKKLSTEQRNPASQNIDVNSTAEILAIINNEDKKIAFKIEEQLPYIEQAVELVVNALGNSGRLIYVGAGTSGRLGILDAAECPPTFGTSAEMVQGIIAGGSQSVFRAQEGAEDNEESGAKDIEEKNVGKFDVVCGIAASLRTPYVVGAIKKAKKAGARTIYVTTNPRSKLNALEYADLKSAIDVAICPEVGPEVITGSTRMKSGTAQKLVLNMITTAAMVRLGKTYENMMIDLQLTNEKLRERAKRIVMTITELEYEAAGRALDAADNHVKTALVMVKANVSMSEAHRKLKETNGFVRPAIALQEKT